MVTIIDARAFRDAVHNVERESFRPGDALNAMERATVTIPGGYSLARIEQTEGVRIEVRRPDGRVVASVRVRRWAGAWAVQPSPAGHLAAGGVIRSPDEVQAMAFALVEAAHAARRGNSGGRP